MNGARKRNVVSPAFRKPMLLELVMITNNVIFCSITQDVNVIKHFNLHLHTSFITKGMLRTIFFILYKITAFSIEPIERQHPDCDDNPCPPDEWCDPRTGECMMMRKNADRKGKID